MFRLTLVVLLAPLQCLYSSKIILIPWPDGFSHVKVLDKIGVELEMRGHEVVLVLSDMEVHADKVQIKNHKIYNTSYPKGFLNVDFVAALVRDGFTTPSVFMKSVKVLEDACDALLSNKVLLDSVKDADLLINDNAFPCGSLLSEKFSALRVDVGSMGFMDGFLTDQYKIPTPFSYIPIIPWVTPKMSFVARTVNYALAVVLHFARDLLLSGFHKLKQKYQISPDKRFEDILGDVDMLLVRVDWSVEWPRPILPGVKVVGFIGPEPAAALPSDLEEYVNGAEHGLIIVSFGTIVPEYLDIKYTDVMVRALSAFPQRVLWSNIGNYTLPNNSNTKALKWLPQNDLLGHPKTRLFVSHCGMGGTNEAVYHGVPVMAVPFYADQFVSAMKVVSAGMAITVDVRNDLADTKIFQETARELLENSSYSVNAKKLSRLARDRLRTPVEESADWVEFVLRANGTKHLQPEAVNMPWYKHDLLDVKIFLLGTFCFLVFLVFMICKCVWKRCKCCCGRAEKKKKKS